MPADKRLLNTELDKTLDTTILLDGARVPAITGELLVDAVNRALPKRHLPQVCYLRPLGPIETCDTCMVEVNGELVRACGTKVSAGHERGDRKRPRRCGAACRV